MDFIRRFGFYLIGFSIGLVFLAFFIKRKTDGAGLDFCYLPNCRTLKDIRSKPLHFSEEVRKRMQVKTLDSAEVSTMLQEGQVNFSKSDTKSDSCKTYLIEYKQQGKKLEYTIKNCPDEAILLKVSP